MLGESTSTSGNATGSDMSNATSTTSDNATSANNATSTGNTTSSNTASTSNATSSTTSTAASNTTGSDQEIAVIEGHDFAPGQVVLVFSSNELVAIDDVGNDGSIEAKVPTNNIDNELRFVESGTLRTASFDFSGDTLVASQGGDIKAEGGEDESQTAPIAPSGNSTSTTNSTSSMTNSTNSTSMQ